MRKIGRLLSMCLAFITGSTSTVKKGTIRLVPNHNRRFGSARIYILLKLQESKLLGEAEGYYLFTPHQILVAKERAKKNEEDILSTSFLRNLLD